MPSKLLTIRITALNGRHMDPNSIRLRRTEGTSLPAGGGRFLHAPLPQDGRTVLDFNKAFNPYCSVKVYVTCPIPPPGNRIDSPVTAGEMYQGHD
jgi:uncharacterized protein (DUF1684 family)